MPEWTVAGVRKVVATVREKTPDSKILLMGIFPARNPADHPARARIAAVNELIAKLDDGKNIRFLDIGPDSSSMPPDWSARTSCPTDCTPTPRAIKSGTPPSSQS